MTVAPAVTARRARDLEDLLHRLADPRDRPLVCAGGTDLVPRLRDGAVPAGPVVCCGHLPELGAMRMGRRALTVGAAVTYRSLAADERVRASFPALHRLVSTLANPRVRNRGTLGGVLCAARPRYDPTTLLVALDARVRIVSVRGRREMPLAGFVLGARRTALGPDEVLEEIDIPLPPPSAAIGFDRVGTAQGPLVNVAAFRSADRIAVVVGAAGPVPVLVYEAGAAWARGDTAQAARHVAAEAWSETPSPASPWYRSRVAGTLTRRVLERMEGGDR
jgi:CO/xanthine dehydrogenase FAD-binding subunit